MTEEKYPPLLAVMDKKLQQMAPIGALNIKETAAFLSVSPRTVVRLKDNGELPYVRIGGRIAFRVLALNNYLAKMEVGNGKG